MGGQENVTLYDPDSKDDIAKGLITQGLILVELRKEKRFAKLISEYAKAQEKAKANRVRYTTQNLISINISFLAHLSRRYNSIPVKLSSVCVSVNIFKLEYLRNQWANGNEILSQTSLGWGKGCIRLKARSDRNSGVHGNG